MMVRIAIALIAAAPLIPMTVSSRLGRRSNGSGRNASPPSPLPPRIYDERREQQHRRVAVRKTGREAFGSAIRTITSGAWYSSARNFCPEHAPDDRLYMNAAAIEHSKLRFIVTEQR